VSSAFALEEARRNVAAKAAPRVTVLEQFAAQVTIGLEPTREELLTAANQGLPAKDAPILAAAIAIGAQTLVTGDEQHFGHLFGKTAGGVLVCRLSDAIKLITQ
jgi:predicted nucleic acid-binding protein